MATTTSIKLDNEMKERVQRLAAAQKRSAHWVMCEAIGQYVDREEQRKQAWDAAIAAWEEYQATGLHVTADEANAWLRKLAAGERVDPPECHR